MYTASSTEVQIEDTESGMPGSRVAEDMVRVEMHIWDLELEIEEEHEDEEPWSRRAKIESKFGR
jgi:hypothetical protein